MAKYNPKMEQIRENNGKTDFSPEGMTEQDIARAMYVYGVLLRNGPMLTMAITESTGWANSVVHTACQSLLSMRLVARTQMADLQGKPWRYSPIQGKLPEGYTKDMCTSMDNPVGTLTKHAEAKAERTEKAKENPLTRALSKKDLSIPEASLPAYQRFVSDLSHLSYGVKELDDIIGAAIDLAVDRCNHVDRQCPICHGQLRAFGTEARCMSKRCGATADSKKSFELSVRMLNAIAGVDA